MCSCVYLRAYPWREHMSAWIADLRAEALCSDFMQFWDIRIAILQWRCEHSLNCRIEKKNQKEKKEKQQQQQQQQKGKTNQTDRQTDRQTDKKEDSSNNNGCTSCVATFKADAPVCDNTLTSTEFCVKMS